MKETVTLADVANYGNLLIAHANAKRGKTHYRAVHEFEMRQEELLHRLETNLLDGSYRTSRYKNKVINDSGKERTISKLPYYPDRIAHWAIMLQMEPLFMDDFSKRSHAAIKGRGIHTALYQTRHILLAMPIQSTYCLKIDIRKYFQNIDHDVLKEKIRQLPIDGELAKRLDEIVDSFELGVPIGNYPSQFWANHYLTEFDKWLASKGVLHVRYMDDIVIFGSNTGYLREVLGDVRNYLNTNLKVEIKDNWQIFPVDVRGVDFVGYRIFRNRILLRKSTFKKMRRALSKVERHLRAGTFTDSDRSCIASYAGWLRYCTPKVRHGLYKKYIDPLLILIPDNAKFKTKIQVLCK